MQWTNWEKLWKTKSLPKKKELLEEIQKRNNELEVSRSGGNYTMFWCSCMGEVAVSMNENLSSINLFEALK